MNAIKNISIPQPCQQPWQQMTPNQTGRHCDSCNKTVVDFSLMTVDEIVKYLGDHLNVCGRLELSHIDLINAYSSVSYKSTGNRYRKWLITAISFLWSIFALKTSAQTKTTAQQQTVVDKQLHNRNRLTEVVDTAKYLTIRGIVIDSVDFSVPGTSVVSLPSGKHTQTDKNGFFELMIPAADKQLRISSVGYNLKLVAIDKTKQEYIVTLKEMPMVLGEIVINPKAVKQ